jgi:prepilin-type N-terminal cleavage/methylation domain-containing protein
MKKRQSGFSAMEIMIVMAIGLILLAMVTPLVTTALNLYRLRGACSDYSNLVQTARMRAVTDDRYYNVVNVVGLPPAGTMNAWVNTGTTATGGPIAAPQNYVLGDPATVFNPAVVIQPPGGAPNLVNLHNQFLPGIVVGAVAINPNAWGPSFGPRGLPCQATAAAGGTCAYTTTPPCANACVAGQAIAFEVFTQNVLTGVWEAVTINPSGRVRQWHYEIATNTWRPLD